jgi:hypothetical protein
LFRRHVRRGAEHAGGVHLGGTVFRRPARAKVTQVRLLLLVEEDVGRLDVAVNDSPAVEVVERPRELDQQHQGAASVGGQFGHALAKASPRKELHGIVGPVPGLPGVVNRHDVRVIQACQQPGFAAEALPTGWQRDRPRIEHLEGDQSVAALLQRLENDAGAAPGQFRKDSVTGDRGRVSAARSGAGREGHRRRGVGPVRRTGLGGFFLWRVIGESDGIKIIIFPPDAGAADGTPERLVRGLRSRREGHEMARLADQTFGHGHLPGVAAQSPFGRKE